MKPWRQINDEELNEACRLVTRGFVLSTLATLCALVAVVCLVIYGAPA
jgi:hypothetical protein